MMTVDPYAGSYRFNIANIAIGSGLTHLVCKCFTDSFSRSKGINSLTIVSMGAFYAFKMVDGRIVDFNNKNKFLKTTAQTYAYLLGFGLFTSFLVSTIIYKVTGRNYLPGKAVLIYSSVQALFFTVIPQLTVRIPYLQPKIAPSLKEEIKKAFLNPRNQLPALLNQYEERGQVPLLHGELKKSPDLLKSLSVAELRNLCDFFARHGEQIDYVLDCVKEQCCSGDKSLQFKAAGGVLLLDKGVNITLLQPFKDNQEVIAELVREISKKKVDELNPILDSEGSRLALHHLCSLNGLKLFRGLPIEHQIRLNLRFSYYQYLRIPFGLEAFNNEVFVKEVEQNKPLADIVYSQTMNPEENYLDQASRSMKRRLEAAFKSHKCAPPAEIAAHKARWVSPSDLREDSNVTVPSAPFVAPQAPNFDLEKEIHEAFANPNEKLYPFLQRCREFGKLQDLYNKINGFPAFLKELNPFQLKDLHREFVSNTGNYLNTYVYTYIQSRLSSDDATPQFKAQCYVFVLDGIFPADWFNPSHIDQEVFKAMVEEIGRKEVKELEMILGNPSSCRAYFDLFKRGLPKFHSLPSQHQICLNLKFATHSETKAISFGLQALVDPAFVNEVERSKPLAKLAHKQLVEDKNGLKEIGKQWHPLKKAFQAHGFSTPDRRDLLKTK